MLNTIKDSMHNISCSVDLLRIQANSILDPKKKSALGQFFTPEPICQYMASLFENISGDINLLDPGCGVGSLTAAFINEAMQRNSANKIRTSLYEIDPVLVPYLKETINICSTVFEHLEQNIVEEDFILYNANKHQENNGITHVIMNPPYKKIGSKSEYRKALSITGIETVNLYSCFVSLAIKMLSSDGELVAIIPRSFCNGPYYKGFREILLNETAIQHIHIFDSRKQAFSDDEVLQENIIIHCKKGIEQSDVTITSSPTADFHFDRDSGSFAATDMTTRKVSFDRIVNKNDKHKFIHIAANQRDQSIIDRLAVFPSNINELGIKISTGPVVGFRLKEYLRDEIEPNSAPLLYPQHLSNKVNWPLLQSKKPNAISISNDSEKWLWRNNGNFIIIKRFSSKDEKRRIVATFYDSSIPGDLIGFDNKLNVYHIDKKGFNENLAKGLYIYLNSTLVDHYYRQFGGHTQVNATDLRSLPYPSKSSLQRIGAAVKEFPQDQDEIDYILDKEITDMTGNSEHHNPLNAQKKIDEAIDILAKLGMPKAQQNERSALTLLALLNLQPNQTWKDIEPSLLGVTPIMDWCRDTYLKEYAPNTRETFRRQTLHQFIDGGLCLYNPDKPDRPVNSPKACYQITNELYSLLLLYKTTEWDKSLAIYSKNRKTLAQQYAMEREMHMIPLTLPDGTEIKLSAGIHSQLIKDIVIEFGPRFAPGAEVIYLGDTGAKEDFFNKVRLKELGVTVDRKGKLPDVVLYDSENDWLFLIESVTSHGPVDGKRHGELAKLFTNATPGIVYVTAFPDRKIMGKYLADISWESEVWCADSPTHMIHFNGDRFMGPHGDTEGKE